MARAALQIGVRDLAESAQVSPTTITRLERGESLYPRTVTAIRTALETAGVVFIAENGGGGAGVRLQKPASQADAVTPPPFAETIAAALETLPAKAKEAAKAPDPAPGTVQEDH